MPGKIMAIAAHPGDGMFTMGATVAQQIQAGGSGVFLSLSLGERGSATIPARQYGEMQRAAMDRSAKLLGATTAYLTYPDGEVPFNDEACFAVCDLIREHQPAIIVTHWGGSWHKDHQNCHAIVRDAIFYAALPAMQRKLPAHSAGSLYFADNWEDAKGFEPDTYMDIAPSYDRYLEACGYFPMWRGENGFRYNDYYRALTVTRGALSNYQYAVCLMSDPGQRVARVKAL
jgi:N-acetylglucosamine malate deacetylase 1